MSKKLLGAGLAILTAFALCSCDRDEGDEGGGGYALAIGLNAVDPGHYGGWAGTLGGCEPDARDMAGIARDQGLRTEVLLTAEATRDAVLQKLDALAGKLVSGNLLVISYSGHGGQIPELSYQDGDEDDGMDETWCLYDGELLDDELYQAWSKFQSGVRILVFSDSCHSGTVVKMLRRDYEEPAPERMEELRKNMEDIRSIPSRFRTGAVREMIERDPGFRSRLRERTPAIRARETAREVTEDEVKAVMDQASPRVMPFEIMLKTYAQNKEFYDGLQEQVPGEDESDVRATVILISGCEDPESSMDVGSNGLFTMMLKQVWDGGRFNGNHLVFHAGIREKVRGFCDRQSPFFFMVNQNDQFVQERPYTVHR